MSLTQKDDQGNWCLEGVPWDWLHPGQVISQKLNEKLYGALWKLMEYEDTGLTPEEIMDGKMLAGWIPVEERMPEDEMVVLVSCKTKKGICNVNRAYYSQGSWHGSGSMSGVIAWMPLPEPYMGE